VAETSSGPWCFDRLRRPRHLALTAVHEVDWVKVPGHSGDELNERCDRLAVAARERLKAELAARETSDAVAVVTPGELDRAEKLS
jgi:ribonuclease HI